MSKVTRGNDGTAKKRRSKRFDAGLKASTTRTSPVQNFFSSLISQADKCLSRAGFSPRGVCPLYRQHHLAEHLARGQVFMRGARLAQRESAVDHRLQLAGEDVLHHFIELAHGAHVRPQQ